MTDINTLQQLKNRIAEMECHHMEELRKLKADHGQLEVRIKRLQGEEHFTHTLPEVTQGKSHPWRTINTPGDLSLSHLHRPTGRTTDQHPFIDRIREADIPLGWKPLNLEQYDETIDPHEHPDAFLT